jgi:hypothetical protein
MIVVNDVFSTSGGNTGSLRNFILDFQMEALGINATKSLFTSDFTKHAKLKI